MILADTSIWVDHFRTGNDELSRLLSQGSVLTHPFIVAEIALGSLAHRDAKLLLMDMLPTVNLAATSEVRHLIDAHRLYSRGIGFVDAHLIASCLLTPGTALWTHDARLNSAARSVGVATHA